MIFNVVFFMCRLGVVPCVSDQMASMARAEEWFQTEVIPQVQAKLERITELEESSRDLRRPSRRGPNEVGVSGS